MKSGYTNSPVSNAQPIQSEQGFSITLGRFTFGQFGEVTEVATGAALGQVQCMRADSRSATTQAVLAEWGAWLSEPAPAHARRAA